MRHMLVRPALAYIGRHKYLRSPRLAALLFRASLRQIDGPRGPNGGRYVALFLSRPGLTEDVMSVLADAPHFSMLAAPQGIFKAIARGFLPGTIDEQNYANLSPEEEASKHTYRAFLERMLSHLLRFCRIDIIISGNFAYFAEREMHAAAEALGLPFVILHKENLKSPARSAYFENLYRSRRGPFSGRRIIVYNSTERNIQIAAGIVPAERISVCGMPRLDRIHAWRRAAAEARLPDRPCILFFTFGTKTGLPGLRRKMEVPGLQRKAYGKFTEPLDPGLDSLSWEQTARLTMQAVARFADANPHVRVIMKSKRGYVQREEFRAAAGHMPPNVEWIDGGDPLPLLKDAWAVVGMNSSAVLEALAMGKIVLTPGYAEAATPTMQPWLADFGPAVERMQTPEQLVARLSEVCTARSPEVPAELGRAAIEALEQWAGNSDGKASERVRVVIEREVATLPRCIPVGSVTRAFPT